MCTSPSQSWRPQRSPKNNKRARVSPRLSKYKEQLNYQEHGSYKVCKELNKELNETFEWMKWMECMNYTCAYTGIACETPVSVHLGPHFHKMRGSKARVRNISYGDPVMPTLEWWVSRAHPGIDGTYFPLPWTKHEQLMMEWTCNNERHPLFQTWIDGHEENMKHWM